MQSVENIEKILPRWSFSYWIFVREVLQELSILAEVWPEILNRELVVMRHGHSLYLGLLHERFVTSENVLKKVLIDDTLVGQVILD